MSATATHTYGNEEIHYKGDDKKKGRQFFVGRTHSGFRIEMHETILGPGIETHPPHRHEHEEVLIVMEGTMQTWAGGSDSKGR